MGFKGRVPGAEGVQEVSDTNHVPEAEQILSDVTDDLTPWERKFVEDMEHRLKQYGNRTFISDKQIEVLRKIAEK